MREGKAEKSTAMALLSVVEHRKGTGKKKVEFFQYPLARARGIWYTSAVLRDSRRGEVAEPPEGKRI